MEKSSDDVQIVMRSVVADKIVVKNIKEYNEEGEEIKTTQYFLGVCNRDDDDESNNPKNFVSIHANEDQSFVTIDNDNSNEVCVEENVIIWNEICRICAASKEQFLQIFDDDSNEHDFSNKINKYLPVEVI